MSNYVSSFDIHIEGWLHSVGYLGTIRYVELVQHSITEDELAYAQ